MTKLEEVARAIAPMVPVDDSRWRPGHGHNFPREYSESERSLIRGIVLVAVEALSQPSAHMSVEGHEAAEKALGAMFHYPLADPVWKAMVSALLSEAEQEHE